ncbi:mechanosensitive ion channel family protein [Devosia sp.]|uniref:mechanosensitive ion channel family protein n=1 Tax=Devosia sp. TaxID=1871048 RepID=UPI003BAB512C
MPHVSDFASAVLAWFSTNALPIAIALAILIGGWNVARWASKMIQRLLPRAYGVDKTFAPLLAQAARYGIIIFSLVTALSVVGVSSASIYAVLGAAGLAIVLALQGTLSNIAAGIMLIWLRPIAVGEYIVGDGVAGIVVEIGLFGTRLRSSSGLFIFTPNQRLWNSTITNHSREKRRRIDVNISLPDTSDMGQARKAMLRVAASDKRVEVDPAPTVHVDSFAGDRIVLQLRAWVPTPEYLPALRDVTEKAKLAINKQLAQAGERAEVTPSGDPHSQLPGGQAPDIS